MQCAAMAAAIKKEIFEDEERNHRRSTENGHQREDQLNNNYLDMDVDGTPVENGHKLKGHYENGKDQGDLPINGENLMHHELRTHLFLATVSARQQQQQDASQESPNASYHVPCPLCQVPLEQRIFRQHLDHHYPRDSPVCPVIQCGRRFAHPNSVRNHMRLKHAVQWLKMKAMRSSGGPFVSLSSDHAIPVAAASNPFTTKEFL